MEICRSCGSSRIIWAEHDGVTGVVSPDGTPERQYQTAVVCRNCNTVEDEVDFIEEEPRP